MATMGYGKSYNMVYPILAKEASGLLTRVEPFLTPDKFRSRFLKGIRGLDPLTGAPLEYSDDDLKDKIMLAINEAELLTGLTFTRVLRREKHPFDQNLYRSFIHIMSNFRPIVTLEKLSITGSNDVDIFTIPGDWVEAARFFQGQINVVPLTVVGATGLAYGQVSGAAGLMFIAAMNNGISWVPSYWEIEYTTGLCCKDGNVPVVANELVGVIAAINILSMKAALNIATSVSASHDGISQSTSGPGPNIYRVRIEELEAKKKELIGHLKKVFGAKMFLTNV